MRRPRCDRRGGRGQPRNARRSRYRSRRPGARNHSQLRRRRSSGSCRIEHVSAAREDPRLPQLLRCSGGARQRKSAASSGDAQRSMRDGHRTVPQPHAGSGEMFGGRRVGFRRALGRPTGRPRSLRTMRLRRAAAAIVRPAVENRADFFGFDRFVLEQRRHHPLDFVPVLVENLRAAFVARLDDLAHFRVDLAGDLFGVVSLFAEIAAQEDLMRAAAVLNRPERSLMPYCVTIRRASSVAFSKSLLAPVVTSPNLISSESRPPSAIVICASSSSRVWLCRSSSGSDHVMPSAMPRGMIVTL